MKTFVVKGHGADYVVEASYYNINADGLSFWLKEHDRFQSNPIVYIPYGMYKMVYQEGYAPEEFYGKAIQNTTTYVR